MGSPANGRLAAQKTKAQIEKGYQYGPDASAPAQHAPLSREIFIAHGHDEAAKEAVARVLSQPDLKPIILNEKADAGQTVIEKFEKHANVAFAVVLLTPDAIGCSKKEPDQRSLEVSACQGNQPGGHQDRHQRPAG